MFKSRYIEGASNSPTEQENKLAKKFGGKRVRGSGSSKFSKADIRDVSCMNNNGDVVDFLVECKQTDKASISIKLEWLKKITRQANAVEQEPAVAVEIKGGSNDPLCERNWVMIPARVFEKLTR